MYIVIGIIINLCLGVIWSLLEKMIFGEVQPSKVDTLIWFMYLPFVIDAVRSWF